MRLVGVVRQKENSSDMKLEQQGLRIILSYRVRISGGDVAVEFYVFVALSTAS